MGALDLDGVRRHVASAGSPSRRGRSAPARVGPGRGPRPSGTGSHPAGPARRRAPASLRRRHRLLGRAVAALGLLVAVIAAAVLVWGYRLTTNPRPDDPAHVDALLVAYSNPAVYEAALELAGRGATRHLFVSAYLGPDGHEKLCGAPAAADPRLQGVDVECFSPDPVTTQGEVVHAAQRMEALGLHSLGVLTFGEHLERARVLAERCWSGPGRSVAMYEYDRPEEPSQRFSQTVYGTVAFLKVAATPGCSTHSDWLQWPVDRLKDAAATAEPDLASAPGTATSVRSPAVPADWRAQAPTPGATVRED